MTKFCPGCGRTCELHEFNFKVRAKGLLQRYCRECSRRFSRDHYMRNVPYYVAKARARKPADRQALHDQMLRYLLTHPCVDCGEADPIVLDFDHIHPSKKRMNIGTMLQGSD